jgi:hypothetical protein
MARENTMRSEQPLGLIGRTGAVALFALGATSSAAAQEVPCDLTGEWHLSASVHEDAPSSCDGASFGTPPFLVVRSDGVLSLRSKTSEAPTLIKAADQGECKLELEFGTNLCPACGGYSEMAFVAVNVALFGNDIAGVGTYRVETGGTNDDGIRCQVKLQVVGKRIPLKGLDTRFDTRKLPAQLREAYQQLLDAEMCKRPPAGQVAVELHIAAEGGVEQIVVQGSDLLESCGGRTYLFTGPDSFPNPSGRPQVARFTMRLPQRIHR